MPINRNDCTGQKKDAIVKNYFLRPLAKLKLIEGHKKEGCCGPLTDIYLIFSYAAVRDRSDRGTFFVGYDCAAQLISKVNSLKAQKGAVLLTEPPLFNPHTATLAHDWPEGITPLNCEAMRILLLLASLWDIKSFYGAPANILIRIVRTPGRTVPARDLLKIAELIGKSGDTARNWIERIRFDRFYGALELASADKMIH
jgi:hypothetical protein